MVQIIFVDQDNEEIESYDLYMTIEDAIKSIPNLDFRVGEGMYYEKIGTPIVDLDKNVIEIQLDVI